MKNNEGLINYLSNDVEVKRIKVLEKYIKTDKNISDLFSQAKLMQKKLVNAREYNQPKQYQEYLKEYNSIIEKLLDLPFVEEYLDLMDSVNEKLNNCFKIIEDVIYKKLNEN